MSLLLWMVAGAFAADHELTVDFGTHQTADRSFDLFSSDESVASRGVRVGVAVSDRLAIVGDWHHQAQGARTYAWETDDCGYYDECGDSMEFIAAWRAEEFALGAKYDVMAFPWLQFYGVAQADALIGHVWLDADSSDPDSPSQVKEGGFAPGGQAALGIEARLPQGGAPFTLGADFEVGYAVFGKVNADPIGNLDPSGAYVRLGAGVRF